MDYIVTDQALYTLCYGNSSKDFIMENYSAVPCYSNAF